MSLSQKINDEMFDLATKIIRRAAKSEDKKLVLLSNAWFDLKRLLEKAEEIEEIGFLKEGKLT